MEENELCKLSGSWELKEKARTNVLRMKRIQREETHSRAVVETSDFRT